MLRLSAVVLVSLAATVSCKSNEAQPAVGTSGSAAAGSAAGVVPPVTQGSGSASEAASAPGSAIEQVQRWAPKGAKVTPAEIAVPGIDLFAVTGSTAVADGEYAGGALVGVAGGKILEDHELVRAVIAAKPGPKVIARVALWVAQRDSEGSIVDAANTRAQRKAKVGAPTIKGGALVFWVATTEEPRILELGKVDLATGMLELEPPPMSHDAAIGNAIATLAGAGVSRYPGAIKTLVAACAEPKARQALLSALSTHPRDRTRTAIANQVHKCGAPAVAPLINLMEGDRSAMVRSEAATALGKTRDSRARPALAKAARGEDANLAWAAKNALSKLQ